MHTNIDYSSKVGLAKQKAACTDLMGWIGSPLKYRQLVRSVQYDVTERGLSFDEFTMTMALLAGVQGYPVRAFWERYIGTPVSKKELH